jgi:hypothetical protein
MLADVHFMLLVVYFTRNGMAVGVMGLLILFFREVGYEL